MAKKRGPIPNFHPISALPMIGSLIVEQLRDNESQYETLLEARAKPHVLDDALLERTRKSYQEQLDFYWVYKEQLSRWARASLPPSQMSEVQQLANQNDRNKEVCEAILALVDELKTGSIDRILEKDDLELGLDILTGRIKPPRR